MLLSEPIPSGPPHFPHLACLFGLITFHTRHDYPYNHGVINMHLKWHFLLVRAMMNTIAQ